jgi:predicted transcriptional regulator
MNTLTMSVETFGETITRAKAEIRNGFGGPRYSFPSLERFWQVMTPPRWDLLTVLAGQPPMSLASVAAKLTRDQGEVAADAEALAVIGVIDRTEDGTLDFPYDGVHVDFMMTKAA